MLKTLDLYIIRKYLTTFFFCVLIFSIIAIAIDFSEKVDDFIEEDVTTLQVIREYYLNFIPHINGLLWPVYAMLSVIFFTSRMAYNSEIISIFNSGTSFYRMMWPYFVASSILFTLHYVGNHYVIPEANKSRVKFENTYIWKHNVTSKTKDIHRFLSENTKVYFRNYNLYDSLAFDISLEEFDGPRLKSKLMASRAKWNGEKQTWQLNNYRIRTITANGLYETLESGKKLDTAITIHPRDLEQRTNDKEMMTTAELIDFVKIEKERGATGFTVFEVERYRRTADAFTIFILTFIGMAVAARKVRGGMGFHLAIGAGLSGFFVFLSKFSMTFSTNGEWPPYLGCWIPNIVFLFVIIFLISRAQK